ncbi:MAG: chromosomal replication initiator protein DnaA [Opitutales bacterium]
MPLPSQSSPLWNTVKSSFQSLFPHEVYHTWFEPLQCLEESDDRVTLGVPNEFTLYWMQDNYEDLIRRKLSEVAERSIGLDFQVQDESLPLESSVPTPRREAPTSNPAQRVGTTNSQNFFLNPRNTFANFVVGPGNNLAHAASIAIANNPAKAYNPLFLYGDTGLGKTHLMHAVAHQISQTHPSSCIAYISTENFTNQYIEAIQSNTVTRFRQRFRRVNVLLIDDVQFLEGKERIQEEFFHTFNELFEQQKQIVLTSDRPASEIAKLEARLVSRFQWGLVADIQPPDFETRLAILSNKAAAMNLELPEPVLRFLGEKVSRNVRRMEGALNRVAGIAALLNERLDLEVVERLLRDILAEEAQERISIEKIQQRVADHHKMKVSELTSRRRTANIVLPRQIAMYLCRVLTSHSLQEIGTAFGKRDHGTVIHACKTIENLMEQDATVSREVGYLQSQMAARP